MRSEEGPMGAATVAGRRGAAPAAASSVTMAKSAASDEECKEPAVAANAAQQSNRKDTCKPWVTLEQLAEQISNLRASLPEAKQAVQVSSAAEKAKPHVWATLLKHEAVWQQV